MNPPWPLLSVFDPASASHLSIALQVPHNLDRLGSSSNQGPNHPDASAVPVFQTPVNLLPGTRARFLTLKAPPVLVAVKAPTGVFVRPITVAVLIARQSICYWCVEYSLVIGLRRPGQLWCVFRRLWCVFRRSWCVLRCCWCICSL